MGNHETRTGGITTSQWRTLTKNTENYYRYSCNDTEIIVLDFDNKHLRSVMDDSLEHQYFIDPTQMNWLEKTLGETRDKLKVVFVHQPLLPRTALSPDIKPEKDLRPSDREALERLFSQYGVRAVFSGHVEIPRYYSNGSVDYFTLPGIYKSKDLRVSWLHTFAEVIVPKTGAVSVKLFYKRDLADTAYQTVIIPSSEFEQLDK